MDLLCFCSVLCLLCLCARLFKCALWSPAGKGLTTWLSFVVSAVSLSLSHWYPGSGAAANYFRVTTEALLIDHYVILPIFLKCFCFSFKRNHFVCLFVCSYNSPAMPWNQQLGSYVL